MSPAAVVYGYNAETESYEVVGTNGPTNGVQFKLYSVNPITQDVVLPLVEIGHANLLDEGDALGANAVALRLQLVSEGTTFLDYALSHAEVVKTRSLAVGVGAHWRGQVWVPFYNRDRESE